MASSILLAIRPLSSQVFPISQLGKLRVKMRHDLPKVGWIEAVETRDEPGHPAPESKPIIPMLLNLRWDLGLAVSEPLP